MHVPPIKCDALLVAARIGPDTAPAAAHNSGCAAGVWRAPLVHWLAPRRGVRGRQHPGRTAGVRARRGCPGRAHPRREPCRCARVIRRRVHQHRGSRSVAGLDAPIRHTRLGPPGCAATRALLKGYGAVWGTVPRARTRVNASVYAVVGALCVAESARTIRHLDAGDARSSFVSPSAGAARCRDQLRRSQLRRPVAHRSRRCSGTCARLSRSGRPPSDARWPPRRPA
jgi:hypothetical protein